MEQFLLVFPMTMLGMNTTNGATNLVVHIKVRPMDPGQDIEFLDALLMMSLIGIGVIVKKDIGTMKLWMHGGMISIQLLVLLASLVSIYLLAYLSTY